MRLLIFIISFCFSCLSFGQDSLQIDTIPNTFTSAVQDSILADSVSSILNKVDVKTKKQRKKGQKFKIKAKPNAGIEGINEDVDASGKDFRLIFIGTLIIAVILILAFHRSTLAKANRHITSSSKDDEFISDYLSRIFLTRRDYYRNVYLNSEAWQRKRYVVLKRDNWQCVYCGGRATQVHHTRYAKRNIGKEPIEWLVSICKTCHDSKH